MLPGADKRMLTRSAQHVGDGVAVVVARTRRQAARAAAQAPVTWRRRPALLTLDEALASSQVLCQVRSGNRRAKDLLAAAEVVVRDRFEFAAAQHTCLEAHACAATPGPAGKGLEIWTNTQCPAEVRRQVAALLGLDELAVRVRKVDEGGGFGAKQDLYEEALVGWLALRLGRCVRLGYSRSEELLAGRTRAAGRISAALGFDRGGSLLACEMSAVLDSGAYASHTPQVLSCLPGHVAAVYPRAAHWYQGTAVRTNTIPAGAYRGYGVAEANFAVEQLVDAAAARLGMGAAELRLRNLADDKDGRGVAACLRLLGDPPHPAAHRRASGRPHGQGHDGRGCRGQGLAVAAKHSVASADPPDMSVAMVTLWPGPMLLLSTGTCDSGTGSTRALARIVAGELHVPLDAILVREGDTAGVSDIGSTAQRSVFLGGEAARRAARLARADILRAGASLLRARRGEAGDLALRWPHLADAAGHPVVDLGELALAHPPGSLGGRAATCPPGRGASYCALSVEVAVDTETGQIRVERAVAAVDCGRVVEPAAARGQVAGGIVQGVGLACCDAWLPGVAGAGPGGIFEHGAPGAPDAPVVTVLFAGNDAAARPHGVGELPIVPVAAAVANAVAAATGVRCTRVPLRPQEVWSQLAGRQPGSCERGSHQPDDHPQPGGRERSAACSPR
jgi:xanthine dehydrogenase molybdenum-binding subunit